MYINIYNFQIEYYIMCQLKENDLNITISYVKSHYPLCVSDFFANGHVPIDPSLYIVRCNGHCFDLQSDRVSYTINYLAWHDLQKRRKSRRNDHDILDGVETFYGYNAALTAYLASSVSHAVEVSVGDN